MGEELGDTVKEGLGPDVRNVRMKRRLMGEMFAAHRQLKAGDTFQIDWIPGQGTVITVKGQPQGEPYKEPEFFNALLRIWLGPNPADWKLKDALLGKAPA